MELTITEVAAHNDLRGEIYAIAASELAFLGQARNIHFGTVTPGSVRGNHFHKRARELLIVRFRDAWRFAWAAAGSTLVQTREFGVQGCVLIRIGAGVPHAVENLGAIDLSLLSVSNLAYRKDDPDLFPRLLIK